MNQPDLNISYNVNYKLVFKKAPELEYFCQSVPLPTVSLGEISTPWQNFSGYMPDNRIEYSPLTVTFLLMENMDNYFYLVDWMRRIADKGLLKDQFQDCTLVIMNNNRLGNRNIKFIDVFPTDISELNFESGVSDIAPLLFTATFRYQLYEMTQETVLENVQP